jgi:hypothetical protein
MSMLTEQEYEEYIGLLRAWVDAEKALEGPVETDAEATARVREAHAAVASFRERYGLGGEGSRPQAPAPVYTRRRQAEA